MEENKYKYKCIECGYINLAPHFQIATIDPLITCKKCGSERVEFIEE